jgi:hypothetical protein
MAILGVTDWMSEYGRPGVVWYVKRLAANDTLATHANQAGPYISKDFLLQIFPDLNRPNSENPDHSFDLHLDSHSDHTIARAVWYNNRVRGEGTRNEARITRLGGIKSALLNPDSTGSLAVFAFVLDATGIADHCRVWVCSNQAQEDLVEERLGPVDPGTYLVWKPGETPSAGIAVASAARGSCFLKEADIPAGWRQKFPTGAEIVRKSIELDGGSAPNPDYRLMRRRKCEFEIFKSVEQAFFLPRIREGFQTVDGFISLAQTVLQSRKSRSGKSLELHAREIMAEEGLRAGIDFVHGAEIEGGKRPDFLFPGKAAYENLSFPASKLRVLAAKTTCKDRWRQVLNEADRIPTKHLLTLQDGVSEGQFREMSQAGVQLVVPAVLHKSYPAAIRKQLMTFHGFLADVRKLASDS